MILFLVLFAIFADSKSTYWFDLNEEYTFERYQKEFNKHYSDVGERKKREQIFRKNLKTILEHNKLNKSWKMGVNEMTDETKEEFRTRLGLNRALFFKQEHEARKNSDWSNHSVPVKYVDWREQGIISSVKDQGKCGSCYTFGSSETIESYYALATGELPVLSQQFLLDCTNNSEHCGGTGGCGGGTARQVVETVIKLGGIPQEYTYPYMSYFGVAQTCVNDPSKQSKPFAKVQEHIFLPPNEEAPVLQTLAHTGPLITNVMASDWQHYEAGVFSGCPLNATIDHVVQIVGYGEDEESKLPYYLVRNSWNPSYGEEGYIRLLRHTQCGYDHNPQVGNTCTGGPSEVQVCGECGILYSNSFVDVVV